MFTKQIYFKMTSKKAALASSFGWKIYFCSSFSSVGRRSVKRRNPRRLEKGKARTRIQQLGEAATKDKIWG